MIYQWRRLDEPGLETLRLEHSSHGYRAVSIVATFGALPLTLCYQWQLDRRWRTQRLMLQLLKPHSEDLQIERLGSDWWINGHRRKDLAHCEEIDLSATPFCNSVAIQQLRESATLTALFIDAPTLEIQPSRQRYQRHDDDKWHYIDEGVACGFEASLKLDHHGLVTHYEGLFEVIQ